MADEFIKGLGILTGAGLLWMVFAGWYNTPSFEGPQLWGPTTGGIGLYGGLAITLRDVMAWFAITGVLVFWVVIPAIREARAWRAAE